MAHMDIAERRLPQDGRINLTVHHGHIDVRVSTIPTSTGKAFSLRLLSRSDVQNFGLDRLDMSAAQIQSIRGLLQQPNGIILVTGPTVPVNRPACIASSARSTPSAGVSSPSRNL